MTDFPRDALPVAQSPSRSLIERATEHWPDSILLAAPPLELRPAQRVSPQPTATEQEPAPKKGLRRRDVLGGIAAAAGTAALGKAGLDWVYQPQSFNFGLLKYDAATDHYAVLHRGMSTRNKDGLIEPAKSNFAALDAEKIAADGSEALVLSPELQLKSHPIDPNRATDRHASEHRHDPQQIKLSGHTQAVYIPYHLFQDACAFNISVHVEPTAVPWDGHFNPGERPQVIDGKPMKIVSQPRLRISILGYPEKADLPLANDIAHGATGAADTLRDTATAAGNAFQSLFQSDEEAARIAREQQAAITARETAKPHQQLQPKCIIDMDCLNAGDVPDLHFYNGRTLDQPTYRIDRETIARAMAKADDHTFHIIQNHGMNYDLAHGGIGDPQGVHYVDDALRDRAHAARLLSESVPEHGPLKAVWERIKGFAGEDNKLRTPEMGALYMATQFQEAARSQRLGDNEPGATGWARSIMNHIDDNLAPDTQHIGR